MLVSMKEILVAAKQGGYCVPAPNYFDAIQLDAAVKAAEKAKSPLILDICFIGCTLNEFIALLKASRVAAKAASIPVCINLDHGGAFEHIVQAIYYGCTSVMIDRSSLSFEENVLQTAEIVKIAHACGIDVESELGHVGQNMSQDEGLDEDKEVIRNSIESDEEKRKLYTKPDEAIKFVNETGVDFLAVAVGTVHGLYPAGFKPSIDFALLKELSEKVSIPLVLHGGSGTGDDLLCQLGPNGACKLNVGSDLFKAYNEGLVEAIKSENKKPVEYAANKYTETLIHYMEVLGSAGKAA